jgi:hypothetical protein
MSYCSRPDIAHKKDGRKEGKKIIKKIERINTFYYCLCREDI